MKKICNLIFFLIALQLTSQNKYEREIKIEKQEVPKKALDFIQTFPFSKKVKWYKEIGINTSSFEAKATSRRKKYSIEFNTKGDLEDIEIIIRKGAIPTTVYEKISSNLQQKFSSYGVEKIQVQYSGGPESVREKVISNKDSKNLITRYEFVVSAKKNGKYQKFECLFSKSGNLIQQQTILLKNTDNLEY